MANATCTGAPDGPSSQVTLTGPRRTRRPERRKRAKVARSPMGRIRPRAVAGPFAVGFRPRHALHECASVDEIRVSSTVFVYLADMFASRCPPVGVRRPHARPTPASSAVPILINDSPPCFSPTRSRARERWARQGGRIRQARGFAPSRANTITRRGPDEAGSPRPPSGSSAAPVSLLEANKMFAILDEGPKNPR
jgi:hypothetical protein